MFEQAIQSLDTWLILTDPDVHDKVPKKMFPLNDTYSSLFFL